MLSFIFYIYKCVYMHVYMLMHKYVHIYTLTMVHMHSSAQCPLAMDNDIFIKQSWVNYGFALGSELE